MSDDPSVRVSECPSARASEHPCIRAFECQNINMRTKRGSSRITSDWWLIFSMISSESGKLKLYYLHRDTKICSIGRIRRHAEHDYS
ncbi:hypothetical protein L484_008771 [Morus notabilis]|uniref:Uncharacterized protein n=1 Tax=Morus notabilis TaxID=981085 RepID=W9RIB9_9ROSA|nr:hypothetical protein L484_008771 [Morus notabilis]